jgi:ketosteroid isomerase-like protein
MNAEDLRSRVAAYYAAVRAGDIDTTLALFAPDAAMRDPVGTPPAIDEAQRRQRYAGIAATFDAFSIDEDDVIVCGDEAAARWTIAGRLKNGRELLIGGMSTFEFGDDGSIQRMSAYWDPAEVVKALAG